MVQLNLLDRTPNAAELSEIKEIFFICSSRKTFASEDEKEQFFQTWLGYYLENCRESFYVARSSAGPVIAYLAGCLDSLLAGGYFFSRLKSYSLFEKFFADYPAHLHINCHPDFQGRGIGRLLIDRYCADLVDQGVKGVHLVTSPEAPNAHFYRKLGFTFEDEQEFNNRHLLFMGRRL